jgi:hypothetical protein
METNNNDNLHPPRANIHRIHRLDRTEAEVKFILDTTGTTYRYESHVRRLESLGFKFTFEDGKWLKTHPNADANPDNELTIEIDSLEQLLAFVEKVKIDVLIGNSEFTKYPTLEIHDDWD